MKSYYRIMLGPKSVYADECRKNGFIGAGFIKDVDLTNRLSDNWRDFNKEFIPIFLEQNPTKTKVSAGLACGMLWTICKGVNVGDVVLCPDGKGNYYVGEVIGGYQHIQGSSLQHHRPVRWFDNVIAREKMSESLQNSTGSIGTVSDVSRYAEEIESLLLGHKPIIVVATDESVESPSEFALEKHLEDFLVQNWPATELGKMYDIYQEDGEVVGQQYPSDTGPIDILAISKDKNELVVIELKKGRASDVVIGQVQRYMGYVKDELAEEGQTVKGVVIAFEDDVKIRRAISVAPNIGFYTYKINFKLEKR